jgi:hypothetical protein
VRGAALALVVAAAVAAAPRAADADDPFDRRPAVGIDPCADRLLGPAGAALDEAGIDRPRQACVADGALVAARGEAAIDLPAFYGTLAAAWLAEARAVSAAGVELTAGARLIDYRFAQNAVATADELTGGPLYLGAARAVRHRLAGRPLAVLHGVRIAVPWSDAGRATAALIVVPSLDASLALAPRLQLHGRAALRLWTAFAVDGAQSRGALSVSADAAARRGRLAVALGAVVELGAPEPALDRLAGRAALRIGLGAAGRLELAGVARLLGRDRTDALAELLLAVDL